MAAAAASRSHRPGPGSAPGLGPPEEEQEEPEGGAAGPARPQAAEVEVELEVEPGERFPDKQRILIVAEDARRAEEAVLCQEVDWDPAGVASWQRAEGWSPEEEGESGRVVSPRSCEERPRRPTLRQGPSRDPPAQRRRKSEYPRRRSCISFTFGPSETGGRRAEEGEEPPDNRDLQRLGTAHSGCAPDLPVFQTAPVAFLRGRGVHGRWRGKEGIEQPEPEGRWEAHYWEKASPCPEAQGPGLGSRRLADEEEAVDETETETMQLICESVTEMSQEEGGVSLAGIAASTALSDSVRDPELEHSEEPEGELGESDDDVPFRDDPKDEMYEPSPHRERGKPRRRGRKEKLESVEQLEPPKRKLQRPKEDRGPRPPKKRKKPPIQYVRCEMEGCGTILANPRYLQHHMRYQHMLKKKYVCPHPSCGRLFRLQKQLLRHTKHHSDQRDYICEYCARAFKSSHNLAVHRMIHTGEKPLQCEICGFTCRQKASLNWHMKKHDADANYQFSCNVCGKKFEKKDSVVAHKSKSHPELVIAEALADNAEIVQP